MTHISKCWNAAKHYKLPSAVTDWPWKNVRQKKITNDFVNRKPKNYIINLLAPEFGI
jgi:hypothetical protein